VKDGNKDAHVIMISKYLRSKTRELDKRTYTITFRDLDRILRKHGYEMINPDKNSIDIVRVEHRSASWFRRESVRRQKIMSLGFPGWTKQVAKGDIKAVRLATGLTHERGIDSQAFFNGVEDLHTLIVHYQEPLKRLPQR
jgi:death-on-curing protein